MTDDASEPEKKVRGISLVVTDAERLALEEWMRANGIFSRGAAVRCMMRFALANGVKPDAEVDHRRKSS